jgi:hypothetical protein
MLWRFALFLHIRQFMDDRFGTLVKVLEQSILFVIDLFVVRIREHFAFDVDP